MYKRFLSYTIKLAKVSQLSSIDSFLDDLHCFLADVEAYIFSGYAFGGSLFLFSQGRNGCWRFLEGVRLRPEKIMLFSFWLVVARRRGWEVREGFNLGTIRKVIGVVSLQIWREAFIFSARFEETVDVEEEFFRAVWERLLTMVKYIEIIGVFHGQSLFNTFFLKFKILWKGTTLQLRESDIFWSPISFIFSNSFIFPSSHTPTTIFKS